MLKELSKICGIEDFGALGMEMFKVKSEVEGTPIRELVMRDYKNFDMHGFKVGVGQLEVVDGSVFDKIKDDLMEDIKKVKDEQNLHTVALLLTDIMKEGSEDWLVTQYDTSIFEKAFNCKLEDGKVWLDGCLSRKKTDHSFLRTCICISYNIQSFLALYILYF